MGKFKVQSYLESVRKKNLERTKKLNEYKNAFKKGEIDKIAGIHTEIIEIDRFIRTYLSSFNNKFKSLISSKEDLESKYSTLKTKNNNLGDNKLKMISTFLEKVKTDVMSTVDINQTLELYKKEKDEDAIKKFDEFINKLDGIIIEIEKFQNILEKFEKKIKEYNELYNKIYDEKIPDNFKSAEEDETIKEQNKEEDELEEETESRADDKIIESCYNIVIEELTDSSSRFTKWLDDKGARTDEELTEEEAQINKDHKEFLENLKNIEKKADEILRIQERITKYKKLIENFMLSLNSFKTQEDETNDSK